MDSVGAANMEGRSAILSEPKMGHVHMVALVEGLQGDFPIAGHDQPFAPSEAHLVQLKWCKCFGGLTQIGFERLAIGGEINEDKAAPRVALNWFETYLVFIELIAPIVALGDKDIFAVQVPLPAMKGAAQALRRATPPGKAPAAMLANIVERVQFARGRSHDDD